MEYIVKFGNDFGFELPVMERVVAWPRLLFGLIGVGVADDNGGSGWSIKVISSWGLVEIISVYRGMGGMVVVISV